MTYINRVRIQDDAGDSCMDGTNNAVNVNVVAGGAGDGAILDGVSSSIKATVLDYTNSNPLAVRLTDTSGDYVSAGAGTQYTEDAAAAANPTGTAVIMVRADSLAALTSADGDNVAARGTDKGELYVKHVDAIPVTDNGGTLSIDDGAGSITVDGTVAATQSGTWNITNVSGTVSLPTGAATSAKQDTQITAEQAIQVSVELIDDAIKTDDAAFTPATTKVMMVGFEFDDTTPDSVDEGDAGAARMSANRNVYTQIRDAAGNERGVNVTAGNALTVDGSAVTQPISHAALTELAAAIDTEVQVDIVGALPAGTNNIGDVDIITMPNVTNAGTFAVQESGAALTALQLIDDVVYAEDVAAQAADKGIAILAVRRDADTSLVGTDNDYANLQVDANGYLKVEIFDGGGSHTVDGTVAATQSGTWTLGANSGVDIGDVTINNSTGASAVNIQDGGNSITIDGTVTASNTAGDIAHDSADSGNPVKIGAKAVNALPTAVANNDRTNAISDLWGRILTSHIDPAMQVWKSYNTTTQATGADVWTPASGKKIAITYIAIGTYGTTAGRLILFFSANADTTYSAGTDQLVFAGSFAPSTTSKPGAIICPPSPIYSATADYELHITTDAALSVDITVYGYEI